MIFKNLFLVCFLALLISGCGGGGGGGSTNNCSGGQNVYTSFDYANLTISSNVGTAITPQTPSAPGIPASCMSSTHYAIYMGTLPPGLALNSTTGVISGAPTTQGYYLYGVSLTLSGFTGSVSSNIAATIVDPSSYSYQGWSTTSTSIPLSANSRLDSIGNSLVGVSSGTTMDTFTSPDGINWTQSSASGPTAVTTNFATTSDGTSIYLSGGITSASTYTSDVWKFDGTNWSQRTAAGAFTPRKDHSMVKLGTTLFVIGGQAASGYLGDVWKSTDDGATWSLASTPFSPRSLTCAVSFNNKIVVMGGRSYSPGNGVPNNFNEVWESADGINWTSVSLPANSPFRGSTTINQQCMVMNGRVYFLGAYTAVSSNDLINWQFEPSILSTFPVGGSANINGKIYVANDLATSTPSLKSTTP
jgi:hypothetical protein